MTGPRFARASYALFFVAVFAAIAKLSGVSGAEPRVLQTVPAQPAVQVTEPVSGGGGFPDLSDKKYLLGGYVGSASRPDEPTRTASVAAGDDAGDVVDDVVDDAAVQVEAAVGDPSVFRRPSLEGDSGEPVCGDLGDYPGSSRAVFPLPDEYFDSFEAGWGSPRPQGAHEGTDLMSPTGTPEFAITDGTVVEVAGSNENGWNRLGGYTVMIEAAYDMGPIKKGDLFYYAHMDRESALPVGTKVRAGQQVGVVGDTGQGPEVTRGLFPPHLHLGWYDMSTADSRSTVESGAMDPYPLLLWLEENGGAVSGGTDASYCEAPQGPVPTSESPSTSPDLDTGITGDARPSPIVRETTSNRVAGRESGDKKGGVGRSRGHQDERDGERAGTPYAEGKEGRDDKPRPVEDDLGRKTRNKNQAGAQAPPRPDRDPAPPPKTDEAGDEDEDARVEDRDERDDRPPRETGGTGDEVTEDDERDDRNTEKPKGNKKGNKQDRSDTPDAQEPEDDPVPATTVEPVKPQPGPGDEEAEDKQDENDATDREDTVTNGPVSEEDPSGEPTRPAESTGDAEDGSQEPTKTGDDE